MPHDFLSTAEIRQDVVQTIARIENYIVAENDIQHAYDEFESLIKTEMKNKLSTHKTMQAPNVGNISPIGMRNWGAFGKKYVKRKKYGCVLLVIAAKSEH